MNKNVKIVFNTTVEDSPSYLFYKSGMGRLKQLTFCDFNHYENFSVALFMGFRADLILIKKAKEKNPSILVGVVDPRGDHIEKYADLFDFIIVDSIEMMDYFSKYGKPILKYYEYKEVLVTKPPWKLRKKIRAEMNTRKKIVIGYHGNKIHLMGMNPEIKRALEEIGKKYRNVEFWAYYNKENLGIWKLGIPKNIIIKHIQFSDQTFESIISQMDIGITPAMLPFSNESKVKKSSFGFRKILNHSKSDYCFRFKMPTNIGRLIVFAKLGVPVISDMYPSAIEVIRHGNNGFLASSSGGWFKALSMLIENVDLRNKFADNLKNEIEELVNYDSQNISFINFLCKTDFTKKLPSFAAIEDLKSYHYFYLGYYAMKKKIKFLLHKLKFLSLRFKND